MIALLESNFWEAFVYHRCKLVGHLESKILDLGKLAGRFHSSELEEFQELQSMSFKRLVCTPQLGGGIQEESWVTVVIKKRACTLHRGGISRGDTVKL